MRKISADGFEDFYWKTNKEWYYYDFDKKRIVLTEKAPAEAIASFKNWQEKYKF